MPYWSVEDWRVRIGSSWDAVGHKSKKLVHCVFRRSRIAAAPDYSMKQNCFSVCFWTLLLIVGCWHFQETAHVNSGMCTSSSDHQIAVRLHGVFCNLRRRSKSVWSDNQIEQSFKPCLALLSTAAMIIILRCGDVEMNPGPGVKSKFECYKQGLAPCPYSWLSSIHHIYTCMLESLQA